MASSEVQETDGHITTKRPKRWATYVSMWCGHPYWDDEKHRELDGYIRNSRHPTPLKFYSRESMRHREDGQKPIKTLWALSSDGAYMFLRMRYAVIDPENGTISERYAATPVFSPYPSLLEKIFFDDCPEEDLPSAKDIEKHIHVLPEAYDEISKRLHSNQEEKDYLTTSWMSDVIKKHEAAYKNRLISYTFLTRDTPYLLRSEKNVLWIERDNDSFHGYFYHHPQGTEMLFSQEDVLRGRLSRQIFRAAAIKLHLKGATLQEAYRDAHRQFTPLADAMMEHKDPYSVLQKPSRLGRILRSTKTVLVRVPQWLFHRVKSTTKEDFIVGVFTSSALSGATSSQSLIWPSSGGSSVNPLPKMGQAALRGVGKQFQNNKQRKIASTGNVAHRFLSPSAPAFDSDETFSGSINPEFLLSNPALPLDLMTNTFHSITPFGEEHTLEWARARLLGTYNSPRSTFFAAAPVEGSLACHLKEDEFLIGQRSDGFDILYDPEEKKAFAMHVEEPHDGIILAKPIQLLIDNAPADHKIHAVREMPGGRLDYRSFTSLSHISPDFIGRSSKSIQDVEEDLDTPLNDIGPAIQDLPLSALVSRSEVRQLKNWIRKQEKQSWARRHLVGIFVKRSDAASQIRTVGDWEREKARVTHPHHSDEGSLPRIDNPS